MEKPPARSRIVARPLAVSTQIADDSRMRVTRWDFEPGAETGWHRHGLAYCVVILSDCTFLIETEAGDQTLPMTAGTTYVRPAGIEHNVVNGGSAPMAFVEVEVKG